MDRWKHAPTCGACRGCTSHKSCEPARADLRPYGGVRFTSDGFDCALPVTVDSHSICSFGCLYCFSENLTGHVQGREKGIGQTSLSALERIFAGEGGLHGEQVRLALKYDRRNAGGYPCPVQLGGINDPGDNIERQQGWFLAFAELVRKYKQPVRISTKGNTFIMPDYLAAFAKSPELFWVAFSIISPDDELMQKIDLRAPTPTERLKTMAALSKLGVKTSLRFRPILPGISDSTKNCPTAWRELIHKAADAGAYAISYEVGFYPLRIPEANRKKWQTLGELSGLPLREIYGNFKAKGEVCLRASYKWTEEVMHKIHDEALKCGLKVGVSDPLWKQLSEEGCCCGIPGDDPVFGNWERENATWQLLRAKREGAIIYPEDITPPWAKTVRLSAMCAMGAGPLTCYKKRHETWADKLIGNWNNPASARGPLQYFQGALVPAGRRANGDIGYKYLGLKRQHLKPVFWKGL